MEKRIFGHDPAWVARIGTTVIKAFQERGTMAVAKHFPGIGRTTLDSHLDLPETDLSEDDLAAFDLIPFSAAAAADVSGMMLSHIRYNLIDSKWPASLSPAISLRMLRQKMEFNGLILTDDLDMGAIKNHYDIKTVIRQILLSGVDIALICHKGPDIKNAFDEIIRQNAEDEALRYTNAESVQRILKYKNKYLHSPNDEKNEFLAC